MNVKPGVAEKGIYTYRVEGFFNGELHVQNTTVQLPNTSIFITKIIISGRRRNERDEREGSKEDKGKEKKEEMS